jgi:hypothetical protein
MESKDQNEARVKPSQAKLNPIYIAPHLLSDVSSKRLEHPALWILQLQSMRFLP